MCLTTAETDAVHLARAKKGVEGRRERRETFSQASTKRASFCRGLFAPEENVTPMNPIRCPRDQTEDLCVCERRVPSERQKKTGRKRKGRAKGTGRIGGVQIYADATLMSAEAHTFSLAWTSGDVRERRGSCACSRLKISRNGSSFSPGKGARLRGFVDLECVRDRNGRQEIQGGLRFEYRLGFFLKE